MPNGNNFNEDTIKEIYYAISYFFLILMFNYVYVAFNLVYFKKNILAGNFKI